MKNSIIAQCAIFLVLLCSTPVCAYDFKVDGLCYNKLSDNTVELTWGTMNEYTGDINIPRDISYNGKTYAVVAIGDYALVNRDDGGNIWDNEALTSITIPNSVTSIEDYAFSGCSGLSSITIPNSVTSICRSAFERCNGLTSIIVDGGNSVYDSRDNCNAIICTSDNELIAGCKNTVIPNSVTSIGESAFAFCSGLISITIPNSVTSIGFFAFEGCSGLSSITIPNSVTCIGSWAFESCSGLTSIIVDGGNSVYDSRDNCNAIICTSDNQLIAGCKNTVIPNSVTNIGSCAFKDCSGLTSITIPNSVTSIGSSAFYNCSYLTLITIPNSVTIICDNAFEHCSGLTSITIPNSVKSICISAFEYCSGLTSITIPNSVTSIGRLAFYGCSGLKDVISEIKTPFEISENVFSVYSTAKLTVPKGTKSAYQSTNYWNKFSTIVEASEDDSSTKRTIHVATAGTLPDLISESEKYTIEELTLTGELNGTDFRLLREMAGCNYLGESTSGKLTVLDLTNAKIVAGGEKYLDTYEINGNDISIGGGFHYGIINNNVIPNYVFIGCYLEELFFPNSATSIGSYAFSYCRNLASITIPNSITTINDYAFDGCSGLSSVKVESGNTIYDSRENCNAIIEKSSNTLIMGCKNTIIPSSVTSIGNNAFSNCSGLTSITIPNSVTSIGNSAFSWCSGLSSITIPNSVTSIGNSAFYACSGLTSITISDSVTSIGNSAFNGCSGLTSITIPNSVTSIGNSAFSYCSSVTSITLPNSVTSIGDYVFRECRGLTSIIIPNSVTNIGIQAFSDCSGLTSITLSNSVTSIGDLSFFNCSSLTSITIPNSVTSIGNNAFESCSSLMDVISEIKTPFEITEFVFSVYSTAKLTVPKGTKSAYQSTNYWNKFSNIVEATEDDSSTKRTIHVATAGTLPDLISESEKYTIEELTLTGELNGTDFRLLRDMAGNNYLGEDTSGKLAVLDLTNAKIVAGGEKYLDTDCIIVHGENDSGSFHYSISESNVIPDYVFYGCYLEEIHIPNSVTNIGKYAFFCSGLTSLNIPNSVTSIGSYAFQGCSGLTALSISNSVTSIGNDAFSWCSGLTSLSIPNSVTSIEDGAFQGCSGLTTITIGNSVTSIGDDAFSGCSALTSIEVENGNTVYDSRDNCNAIIKKSNNELVLGCKNTVIPNSVTSIGSSAFSGCSGLTSLNIPDSVTSIGDNAFSDCSGLTYITIPNSVTSIGSSAFFYCI